MLKRPWPAMLRTLYGDDERYVETYWSRFGPETYLVGDAAIRDKDGYFWIVGRIDDVINVSGPPALDRRGRVGDRRARARSPRRPSSAQSDELTGQAIVAFVTLAGRPRGRPRDRGADPRARRRDRSASSPGRSASCGADDLPKTRSGKIMRRLLRDIAEGRALGDVTTLRDPT